MKTLVLKKDQLNDSIIRFHPEIDKPELKYPINSTLKDIGFKNNTKNCLYLKFVRAFAFLNEKQLDEQIQEVEMRTYYRYPRELILQAINMAPECKLNQTLSNLINNGVKVFESILKSECKQILDEVKVIRQQQVFSTCRARYQILGEPYRLLLTQTFQNSVPNVYQHMLRRKIFCDYLLLTDIFTDQEIERQNQELYQRILNQYRERQQQIEMYGRNGQVDHSTQYTCSHFSDDVEYELISTLANRDGIIIQVINRESLP